MPAAKANQEAKQALADLTEISSQVRTAVILGADRTALACTADDERRASALAEAASKLLEAAGKTRHGLGPGALTQLEAATLEGSVFVVCEGGSTIAATTTPEPTVGLVFYDLKSALRGARGDKPNAPAAKPREPKKKDADEKPKPTRTRKKADAEDGDAAA